MNIAIRADGSPEIGMGHIMRCLSLAKAFKKAGCTVCFLSKYHEGIHKIEQEGFQAVKVDTGTDFPDIDSEAGLIVNQIVKDRVDLLIVDTYHISEKYFLDIKPYLKKLVYIDDVNEFVYPVDILINGNITGEYMEYRKYDEDEQMLLGPQFNLIREEFKGLPKRKVNKNVKEIMITTGGSDPFHLCPRMVQSILDKDEFKKLKVNVVIGSLFSKELKNCLYRIRDNHSNIILNENVKYMSEIMLKSDVAVSAGGSTLYELCACGTPTLAVIIAGNQEFLVTKMEKLNYIESLGWYHHLDNRIFADKLKAFAENYERRKDYCDRMQELVDGNGAERVVKEILERLNTKC